MLNLLLYKTSNVCYSTLTESQFFSLQFLVYKAAFFLTVLLNKFQNQKVTFQKNNLSQITFLIILKHYL